MTLSMGADKDIPGQLGKHLTFKCCGFKKKFQLPTTWYFKYYELEIDYNYKLPRQDCWVVPGIEFSIRDLKTSVTCWTLAHLHC